VGVSEHSLFHRVLYIEILQLPIHDTPRMPRYMYSDLRRGHPCTSSFACNHAWFLVLEAGIIAVSGLSRNPIELSVDK